MIQLEIYFILDEVAIIAVGDIVWGKVSANKNQPKLEELIVSELKACRCKEVLKTKKL